MTRRLVYLNRAKRDLVGIAINISIQTGNRTTARVFVERLRRKCSKPARLPGTLGRPRPDLGPDLSSFPVGEHVIFFRYDPDRLVVVAVLSRYRDVERLP